MKPAVLIASFCLCSANAVAAEATYPEKRIGEWEVYGWNDDCWMKTTFEDDTELLYSWEASDNDSYIAIRNPKWSSIEDDKAYSIRVEIDDWSMSDTAHGAVDETLAPGITFFVDDGDKDMFIGRLAVGRSIRFFVGERYVGNYSLKHSYEATKELAKCSGTLQYRVVPDPFANRAPAASSAPAQPD